MEQDDEEEYYPALDACYNFLTEEKYLFLMKKLFNQPQNTWLHVRTDWLKIEEEGFQEFFKKDLSIFNFTLEDLDEISVMWSIPPDIGHGGMYLVLFFNAQDFAVRSCLYNYRILNLENDQSVYGSFKYLH